MPNIDQLPAPDDDSSVRHHIAERAARRKAIDAYRRLDNAIRDAGGGWVPLDCSDDEYDAWLAWIAERPIVRAAHIAWQTATAERRFAQAVARVRRGQP